MSVFQYKAKNKQAQTVTGQITAENREEAIEKINQLNFIPVSIEELKAQTAGRRAVFVSRRVTNKTLYFFTRQLVNLLKAGVPLLRALEVIIVQMKDPYLQEVLQQIITGIREGHPLSDCLGGYPQIFSSLYVTMVKVGEESGNLKETLFDTAQYLKRQEEITTKVKTAMIYPALMAIVGVGTIFFILTFVLPKLTGLFTSVGQELPLPTKIVIALSDFLINWWPWLGLGIVCTIAFFKKWSQSKAGQLFGSQMILGLPVIKDFSIKIELTRFCSTLGLLLKSGVPIVRAIQLSIPVVGNELIRAELVKCQEKLVAGGSLGESLKQAAYVPPMVGHLLVVGEETGSLAETLRDIVENNEQETNETIKVITTLMEPLMILVIGTVVGFIVIAMLLPIFALDMFAR